MNYKLLLIIECHLGWFQRLLGLQRLIQSSLVKLSQNSDSILQFRYLEEASIVNHDDIGWS